MLATLTADAVWHTVGGRQGIPADEYDRVLGSYGWGISETFAAEPTVSGNLVSSTGDYEGLRFVAAMEGASYPWNVTGQIEPVD